MPPAAKIPMINAATTVEIKLGESSIQSNDNPEIATQKLINFGMLTPFFTIPDVKKTETNDPTL